MRVPGIGLGSRANLRVVLMRNWLLRNRPFLVFVPLVAAMAAWAATTSPVGPGRLAVLGFLGLAAWTLVEWVVHRAMHIDTGIGFIERLQDSAHLRHHREPDDLEHSVVRLRVSLPITLFLFGAARLAFGQVDQALAVLCGLLTGYLFYEFVHLSAHAAHPPPGLRTLRRMHLRHHFGGSDRAFGVTSPFWDWIFGTYRTRSE